MPRWAELTRAQTTTKGDKLSPKGCPRLLSKGGGLRLHSPAPMALNSPRGRNYPVAPAHLFRLRISLFGSLALVERPAHVRLDSRREGVISSSHRTARASIQDSVRVLAAPCRIILVDVPRGFTVESAGKFTGEKQRHCPYREPWAAAMNEVTAPLQPQALHRTT